MAAAPSQPISIGRLPPHHSHQSLLSANNPSNTSNDSFLNQSSQVIPGTSPAAYSYLGADLTAQNPRWAGTSASPARNTQELSTSWTIHPGPLFVSSQHATSQASSSSYAQQQSQNHLQPTQGAGPLACTPSSSSAAGFGGVGSYTGGGTPMSLSSSFYARFLPHASTSSSPGFSGPGVLNPLDPTDFKFSSSPYGGRTWGGGGYGSYTGARGLSGSYGRGFVGSMESDRMSLIEGFYGGKGEKDACCDFTCCGLYLKDLHALVEHFETNHADQYPDFSLAAAAAASHPGLAISSSAQQVMNFTHMSRGRRVASTSSGNSRRLANQNSNSSLAGALGEPEPAARARSAQAQQVRTQGSSSNLSSMSSAAGSSNASPMRGRRGVDAEAGGGTAVDHMDIGLDLDMDMDMDVDVDMDHSFENQNISQLQHQHSSHNGPNNANTGNAAQGSAPGSASSGSGTGSPSLGASAAGSISSFVPGPVMRGGYGLGGASGVNSPLNASRATSPPDTPLLSTPITPSNTNGGGMNQASSGYNSPDLHAHGHGQPGQEAAANAYQGFGVSSAMSSANGASQNAQAWGENAMTPMAMEVKQEDTGAYFGQQMLAQEEDSRSGSESSNSPRALPSSASTSTTNLHTLSLWEDGQQVGDQQQQVGRVAHGQGHHGLMHTQSLYALRAAAHEQQQFQLQNAQATAFNNNNNNGEEHELGPDYNNSGLGVGVGHTGRMGHSGGLVDRAAVQRAREREEAILRSGSGVLNAYAGYADWSRGFPGVTDAEAAAGAGMESGNGGIGGDGTGRTVGPTESGVHPGLLFGNPSPAPAANSSTGANGKPTKETQKRVNLKVGLPGSKGPAISSPATPLTATSHETASGSTSHNSSSSTSTGAGAGSSTSPSSGMSGDRDADSSPPPAAHLDGYKEKASDGASGLLLNKPFKCPTPGCTKSYKQANGLKYHVTHGQCSFTPPPELSSLTALSALASSSLSPTSPGGTSTGGSSSVVGGPSNGRDSGASTLTAATLDKLKASLSLTASQTNAPLTLITAEETLARLSAEERREVEREAERRLRPFCCAVPPCQRRYKNMNGLRYHYAHSGEHGRIGMSLLGQGKGTGGSGTGSTSGAQSPTKEGSGSNIASGSGTGTHGGEKKKVMTASAPVTPRAGTFVQQQSTPASVQANGTATMPPLPPFPFPFPFPANMNWASYAQSFGIAFQTQAQAQTQNANTNSGANVNTAPVNANSNATSTLNGGGPRMGTISTAGNSSRAGIILSQPASAYASPWSSRAPSPTRSSSHSPLSNLSAQIATLQTSKVTASASGSGGSTIPIGSSGARAKSPVEEPPQSAYPAEEEDEGEMEMEMEMEEEDAEEGGEFGYPEEVEEEMIEREAARVASGAGVVM